MNVTKKIWWYLIYLGRLKCNFGGKETLWGKTMKVVLDAGVDEIQEALSVRKILNAEKVSKDNGKRVMKKENLDGKNLGLRRAGCPHSLCININSHSFLTMNSISSHPKWRKQC